MGRIYRGSGFNSTLIGEYENGRIYRGSGWGSQLIGEYSGGKVYSGSGWGSQLIGEYSGGKIYSGSGWGSQLIGEYDGDGDGAAAAALLLLLRDEAVDDITRSETPSESSSGSASGSSGVSPTPPPDNGGIGCNGYVLLCIFGILLGIYAVVGTVIIIYSGKVEWDWAFYAMFFTSVTSFIITNVVVHSKYMYAIDTKQECKNLISEGLGWFAILCAGISLIIYIIEFLCSETGSLWLLLAGIVIAPFNVFFFALPFAIIEVVVLIIVNKKMKKAVLKRKRGD